VFGSVIDESGGVDKIIMSAPPCTASDSGSERTESQAPTSLDRAQ